MSKQNPHACRAFDAPFPVHGGGEYISSGRDLASAEPQATPAEAPVAATPPTTSNNESAARRGNKRQE